MPDFKINRVYTKTGDKGQTALVGGARVSKSDLRVKAVGEIDELNSILALVKEELTENTKELFAATEYLQQELFDLGAEVATPKDAEYEGMWKVSKEHIKQLEKFCDHYSRDLVELKSFILPGGSKLAANFHLARAICRRLERGIVECLENKIELDQNVLAYLNRLSDLLFILARYSLSLEGRKAPLWQPERERRSPV